MDKVPVPRFTKDKGFKTSAARSNLMKKIRSVNTLAELSLRKELWRNNVRYRINDKRFPGKPDIVIRKKKIAIFIDGEFWHGYNWEEKKSRIKSNRAFWIPKIERNMQRDVENNEALNKLGFKVIRFWEKEVKTDLKRCIDIILQQL